MRLSDLQADALVFMYAHEFVDQAIDEEQLYDPLVHSIEYPTRAPLSDKIIDRNEVAEKVVFGALADLCAARRLILTLQPTERVFGQRWLCRGLQLFGYHRQVLLCQRDGSFPNSPLNEAFSAVFDELLAPGSDFISQPRVPVRQLLRRVFRSREEERDPYHEILQWVGETLIIEGFYTESTDVIAGAIEIKQAHPDVAKMRKLADRVAELRERLERYSRHEPELYAALKETVAGTMKELSILHQRRFTL